MSKHVDEEGMIDLPEGHIIYKGIIIKADMFPPEIIDRICEFDLRPDDVIVMGYPKSGTTWLQEIVWLLMNQKALFEPQAGDVWDRVPLIEQVLDEADPNIDKVERMKSPRIFKTHLPVWSFEKQISESKCKVLLISRNPKDMLVSFYHLVKMMFPGLNPDFTAFFEKFKKGIMHHGDWFDYMNTWYINHKEDDNYLCLMYEDMKSDSAKGIQDIAKFLGVGLSEENLRAIVEKTTFKSMQNASMGKFEDRTLFVDKQMKFFRRGEIGDWKNFFTVAQNEEIDMMIKEKLRDKNLTFRYE